jgi:hypothetical protein
MASKLCEKIIDEKKGLLFVITGCYSKIFFIDQATEYLSAAVASHSCTEEYF